MIGRWVLPAFAFAVSTAYWPFWHDGAISPKWDVLALLPLVLFFVRPRMTIGHWAGLSLIAYSALSAAWSVAPLDTVNSVLRLALIGTAFVIAAEVQDMRRTYAAAALGISVSGFIALAEVAFGLVVPEANHPSALFGNRNYMGEAAAIVLILALAWRMWWAMPGLILALSLSMSRAAFLAVGAAAFVGLWNRSRVMAGAALATCAIVGFVASQVIGGFDGVRSLGVRLEIWQTALANLTLWGHGAGSFQSTYVLFYHYASIPLGRPENAHNEFINFAFEVGIPGCLAAAVLTMAAWRGGFQAERAALAGVMVVGLFGFPLHVPVTGFLAAILAGRLCGVGSHVRSVVRSRRVGIHARDGGIGPHYGPVGV